jgi:hypothetical protein
MDPSRPPAGFFNNVKVMFDVRDVMDDVHGEHAAHAVPTSRLAVSARGIACGHRSLVSPALLHRHAWPPLCQPPTSPLRMGHSLPGAGVVSDTLTETTQNINESLVTAAQTTKHFVTKPSALLRQVLPLPHASQSGVLRQVRSGNPAACVAVGAHLYIA